MMKIKRKLLLAICLASLCLVAAPPARADLYGTADVQYDQLVRGVGQLTSTFTDSIGTYHGVPLTDVGLHNLNISNLDLPGNGNTTSDGVTADADIPSGSYLNAGYTLAFCVDLTDPMSRVFENYKVVSLNDTPDPTADPTFNGVGNGMGVVRAAYIAELLNTNTYATPYAAAAVQVAIWEIVDENFSGGASSWDVSNGQGDFYLEYTVGGGSIEETIAGLANTMLNGLPVLTPSLSIADRYTALTNQFPNKQVQDYVVVPAPAAVLLGILGLGVAGWRLRRFA